jgi:hypothetical protein
MELKEPWTGLCLCVLYAFTVQDKGLGSRRAAGGLSPPPPAAASRGAETGGVCTAEQPCVQLYTHKGVN